MKRFFAGNAATLQATLSFLLIGWQWPHFGVERNINTRRQDWCYGVKFYAIISFVPVPLDALGILLCIIGGLEFVLSIALKLIQLSSERAAAANAANAAGAAANPQPNLQTTAVTIQV